MFFDNLNLFSLRLRRFHAAGVSDETFHRVIGSGRTYRLNLFTVFLCSFEALLVRRNTLDRLFRLLNSLVDGLLDILIYSILRFARGTLGGSIHETIDISLSLYLCNIEQHQCDNTTD